MKTEVDKLTEVPGILAVSKTVGYTTEVKVSDGDSRPWAPVLGGARKVLDAAGVDELKVALDKYSVIVMRSGRVTLGVVVIKSHPVVKSLKRMLRRAFKRIGNAAHDPAVPASPETAAPTSPIAGDSTKKILL